MGPRFLIVDDDPTIRAILAETLSSFDCEVDQAEGGSQALGKIVLHHKRQPYDAVFLDIMMPGMNGYEVLKRIKTTDFSKGLPVIMLTAADDSDFVIEAYRSGADYYIPKPFNVGQIIYCLDLLLGEEQAQVEGADQARTEKPKSDGELNQNDGSNGQPG